MAKPNPNTPIPYHMANQRAIEAVQGVLFQMKQPINRTPQKIQEHTTVLTNILKEILETTQRLLLLNAAGQANGVKADAVGWTTASTDYDNPTVLKDFPDAPLVNQILRKLLDEQEKKATKEGAPCSEGQILSATNDAKDQTKSTITLETAPDAETGIKSKVEICKETGDTQLYRQDAETGFWHKVGTKLKGYWQNVKEFGKSVWGWFKRQYTRAKNWICNLFKSPEDSAIIMAN